MSDSLHLVCPHCNTVNRIPSARLEQAPKCGKCHETLFAGSPLEVASLACCARQSKLLSVCDAAVITPAGKY